ncbi:hypothetical protein [Salinarimonas rosea]|uniref:hypothetical protein n=1 Tax=Salinarimonas rosea TaxID=552063 RepID=UPI00040F68B3|nr:hypothetical protein [Salinarimonas rosea]
MATLFANERDPVTGHHVGAYRVFIPVETFDRRANYKKLKSVDLQNAIIDSILTHRFPEVNFGVVLGSDADDDTFAGIVEGYKTIKEVVGRHPSVKARYSVFHLIPISLFRSMETNFSVDDFPEGWKFYFPCYDGKHFTTMELFDRRLATVGVVDPALARGMKTGTYAYA